MGKKPADQTFGKRLTALRKQRGLTMEDLAKRLGVTVRTIFYYEHQSKHPPAHLIPQLSKELNVPVEGILGIKPAKIELDPKHAALWRNLKKAQSLPKKEQRILVDLINVLVAKNRKS